MQRNINYSKTLEVSLSSIASSLPVVKTKIFHDKELNPFVYAIGLGSANNSNVIVGGTTEDDNISSYLIIKFIQEICKAYKAENTIMGIDIKKVLAKKGVWFIPDYKLHSEDKKAKNFWFNKINPNRILELTDSHSGIRFNPSKNHISNSRLLALLLSASSGIEIKNFAELSSNNTFSNYSERPIFSMGLKKHNQQILFNDIDILYQSIFKTLLFFIIA